MATQVIGKTSRYARRLARSATRRAASHLTFTAAAWAGAAALLVTALLGYFHGHDHVWVAFIGGAVLAGAGELLRSRAKASWVTAARLRRGVQAEDIVLTALRRARVSLVVNGADVGAGGDADHVVAHMRKDGSVSLGVVETKAGGGFVRPQGRSLLTGKGGRRIPGDPIAQVQRQARGLAARTQMGVWAVVCVPWMTNPPFTVEDVVVCGVKDLPKLVTTTLPAGVSGATDLSWLIHAAPLKD